MVFIGFSKLDASNNHLRSGTFAGCVKLLTTGVPMNNLKISTRLIILIGVLSALLVGIGWIGLYGISQSNDALKTVYEDRTVSLGQLANVQKLLQRNRLQLESALIESTPEVIKKNVETIA